MALTRNFKQTVVERVERDPAFAKALLDEAATLFLNGETQTARLILRDLVNATLGFEQLAALTDRPSKSLHRMLSPKWHVPKLYLAKLDRPLDPSNAQAFARGITLEDQYTCLPAELRVLDECTAEVVVREGKYHQVRRMFAARGNHVVYLKRLKMGPLDLGDLPRGSARNLTALETAALYESAELAQP